MSETTEAIKQAGSVLYEKEYLIKTILESQAQWFKDICPLNYLTEQKSVAKSLSYESVLKDNEMKELTEKWLEGFKAVIYESGISSQKLLSLDLVKLMSGNENQKTASKTQ